MSDLKRTTFGPPTLTEHGGQASFSAPVTIPAGTLKVAPVATKPWAGWGLKDSGFMPSMAAGHVGVTRRALVGIINEMAQVIDRCAPGEYDFTRAKQAVQDYQQDCVFEVGRPKNKKMKGRVKSVEEVPEAGGEWVVFELHPKEGT